MTSMRSLLALLGERLALLTFLGLNLAVQLAVYLRHEARLQEVVLSAPDAFARASFVGWMVAVLAAFGCVFLLAGVLEARLWRERGRWSLVAPLAIVLQTAVLVVIVVDTRLYETMGLHLYDDVVLHAASHPGSSRELHLGGRSTASLLGFAGVALAAQAALYALCGLAGRLSATARVRLGGVTAGVLACALIAGGALAGTLRGRVELSATDYLGGAPGYAQLLGRAPQSPTPGAVRYPPPEAAASVLGAERPDILFVLVESLRADHFTPELMPNATRYAAEQGCLVSPRHYAGGHTTEYGAFTLLFGLYGVNYEPFSRDGVGSAPLTLLARSGYRVVGASASALRDWNQGDFFFDGVFDDYRELLEAPAEIGDAQVVQHVVEARSAHEGPMFGFAFFNSTHHNYLYPPEFEIDRPVIDRDYDHFMGDDRLAAQRVAILNRYRNSVRYVDHLFGELVAGYRAANGGRAPLLVMTGDHGEEFWERGLLGHGAPRFNEERVAVPLVLCLAGLSEQRTPALAPTSHVDLWPTVLEALGVASTGDWLDGESLLGAERRRERPVWIGGLDFPWDNATGAVVDGAHKFWLRLCGDSREGLCLEPWYVTDMADREVPPGTSRESLRGAVEALRARFGRWVAIEAAGAR